MNERALKRLLFLFGISLSIQTALSSLYFLKTHCITTKSCELASEALHLRVPQVHWLNVTAICCQSQRLQWNVAVLSSCRLREGCFLPLPSFWCYAVGTLAGSWSSSTWGAPPQSILLVNVCVHVSLVSLGHSHWVWDIRLQYDSTFNNHQQRSSSRGPREMAQQSRALADSGFKSQYPHAVHKCL